MPDDSIIAVRPAPELGAAIAATASACEAYIRNEASRDCARFYRLYETLGRDRTIGPFLAAGVERDPRMQLFVEQLMQTKAEVEALAHLCVGLDTGKYEIAAWKFENEPNSALRLGVWMKGGVPKPAALELFPLLPVIVIVAVGLVAGVLVGADLYLAARNTAAKADLMRAQAEEKMIEAIAAAPAVQRAPLAAAFQAALNKADPGAGSGWLTKFGRGLANLATDVVNAQSMLFAGLGEWLPWAVVAGMLLLGGGRRKRRRRA